MPHRSGCIEQVTTVALAALYRAADALWKEAGKTERRMKYEKQTGNNISGYTTGIWLCR
jgi:hypothetical protein